MLVRNALDLDRPAISELLLAAFGEEEGPVIVRLVDALLGDPSAQPLLSLVATDGHRLTGHILFTRASIELSSEDSSEQPTAMLLAPLAVHPDHQKAGIGGQLIEAGLEALRSSGVDLVFVLGHPAYYPRYGFTPAGAQGFEATYPIAPVNADAWMVQALRPGVLDAHSGRMLCADALDDPEYWVE